MSGTSVPRLYEVSGQWQLSLFDAFILQLSDVTVTSHLQRVIGLNLSDSGLEKKRKKLSETYS